MRCSFESRRAIADGRVVERFAFLVDSARVRH